jgi:hypothetical protein
MSNLIVCVILAGTLLSQGSTATDKPAPMASNELKEFLNQAKAASNPKAVTAILQTRKENQADQTWHLCQKDVMSKDFYAIAELENLGVMKRNAIIGFCEAFKLERDKAQPGSLKGREVTAPQSTQKATKTVGKLPQKAATTPTPPSAAEPAVQKEETLPPVEFTCPKISELKAITLDEKTKLSNMSGTMGTRPDWDMGGYGTWGLNFNKGEFINDLENNKLNSTFKIGISAYNTGYVTQTCVYRYKDGNVTVGFKEVGLFRRVTIDPKVKINTQTCELTNKDLLKENPTIHRSDASFQSAVVDGMGIRCNQLKVIH